MSFEGKFTPLQLNALASLSEDTGLRINKTMTDSFGSWSPTAYTTGSITNDTLLKDLTAALPIIKSRVGAGITDTTYRKLLTLGSATCPALGNSRPATFKPSYAGHGSWSGTTMVRDSYPPKGKYDSKQAKWLVNGSPTTSYLSTYGWITGWGDNQSASLWRKYEYAVENTTDYDNYFSNGFLATIPRQAYYEMWTSTFSQYTNIVNSFSQHATHRDTKNEIIGSYVNSKTFMSGLYSNINDMTTSNISGVSLALKDWGNELIATGRVIDLSNIDKFGLPSVLLRTLQNNNVLTDSVKALCTLGIDLTGNGLTGSELNGILDGSITATATQEKKIYDAMTGITGDDLSSPIRGILYGLNCTTAGLETLADLLDPKKLFPKTHNSLTLPKYNSDPSISNSAKIYDFIYISGGVNTRIENWGEYVEEVLSSDQALACGAFSMTMRQIKYITKMDIEKFSQVVANLEVTNLNLPEINTTNGLAVSPSLATSMLDDLALGSGNSGSFRQCDFMGAASGYPYNDFGATVKTLLNRLSDTDALKGHYKTLNDTASTIVDTTLNSLIATIEQEIKNVVAKNTNVSAQLSYFWDRIGTQMLIEQRATALSMPNPRDLIDRFTNEDIVTFVRRIENYALDNSDGQCSVVLAGISDITTAAGQYIIASMREARNAYKLSLTGSTPSNNVSAVIDTCAASATATVVNSAITSVTVTNKSTGYSTANPPTITVYPVIVETQAILTPVIALDGSISSIKVEKLGKGYTSTVEIVIESPPQCQPVNSPPSSYADSKETLLIEPPLITDAESSPDVATAIADVTTCNCDCWL